MDRPFKKLLEEVSSIKTKQPLTKEDYKKFIKISKPFSITTEELQWVLRAIKHINPGGDDSEEISFSE